MYIIISSEYSVPDIVMGIKFGGLLKKGGKLADINLAVTGSTHDYVTPDPHTMMSHLIHT